MPGSISVRALGTTAVTAVTHPDALPAARAILLREVRALDLACSRFRPDSELQRLGANRAQPVSPLLWSALAASLEAARLSNTVLSPGTT